MYLVFTSRPHQSTAGSRSPVPPLSPRSPTVTELLRVCGENIGLITHHEIAFKSDGRYSFLEAQLIRQAFDCVLLLRRPTERALKDALSVECRRCSALGSLLVKSFVLAGSRAEGLQHDSSQPVSEHASDADYMVEFGPVEWGFQTDRTTSKPSSHGGAVDEAQDAVTAPRLTITETGNPGYVLLLQEQRSDCQHREPLPFRAADVKRFYGVFQAMVFKGAWKQSSDDGPACAYTQAPELGPFAVSKLEHVPCLHVPVWWISDEFFTRRRRYSWPPKSARDDIRRYGLHLVAKGARGSITARFEWRISFSRAELIVSLYLTFVQKGAVILFKSYKASLGEESKALKSYYVKTALLWLCEETQPEDWTSAHHGVLLLVEYLDAAVRKKKLPCYFFSQINLFRFVSQGDLKAMERSLATIREHWMRLLAHHVCMDLPDLTSKLIQNTRRLSESELRVYLMRDMITKWLSGIVRSFMDFIDADLSKLLPMLLRSYPSDDVISVLCSRLPRFSVQRILYSALTIAPADIMAEVFQSLSGNSRDGFVWDAAPLLGLLTEDDLKWLLGDPDAVRSCLRRQRRLPVTKRLVGLPADLRSPRDLCDLLLNIPLLVQVIKESVPLKFVEMKCRASLDCATARISMYTMEKMREMTLHDAALWKKLITVFHMVGADQTTARRAACRFGVETRQLCDSPETLEAHRRIGHTLPDAWRMQHLVFDDARIGHVMCVTAT